MIQTTQIKLYATPAIPAPISFAVPLLPPAVWQYAGQISVSEAIPSFVNSLWAAPVASNWRTGSPPAAPPAAAGGRGGANSGRKKGNGRRITPDMLRSIFNTDHSDDDVRRVLGKSLSPAIAESLRAAAISSVSNPRPVKYLGMYASDGDETATAVLVSLRFGAIADPDRQTTLSTRVDRTFRNIDRPLVSGIFHALESGVDAAEVVLSNNVRKLLGRALAGSVESYFSIRNFALAFEPFRMLLKNMRAIRWAEIACMGSEFAKQVIRDLERNFGNEYIAGLIDPTNVPMEWPTANIYEGIRGDFLLLNEFATLSAQDLKRDAERLAGDSTDASGMRALGALGARTKQGDIGAAGCLLELARQGIGPAVSLVGRTDLSGIEDGIDDHPGDLRAINVLAGFAEIAIAPEAIDSLIRLMLEFEPIPELRRLAKIIREKLAAIDRHVYAESIRIAGNPRALDPLLHMAIYVPAVRKDLQSMDITGILATAKDGGEMADEARLAIRDLARIGNRAASSAIEEPGAHLT